MFCPKTIPFVVAILALLLTPVNLIAAETGDDVVAKVGNITIVEQEVKRELQKLIPMQVSFHGGLKQEKLDQLNEQALQTLIDRAYKIQYAISEEIAVSPDVVEKEWQAFQSRNTKGLKDAPAAQMEKYKGDIYLSLLAKKAEATAVDGQISVSDEEVKTYYQGHKENYLQPKLYTASQVFVRVDPSSRKDEVEERQQHAAGLLERARAGEDFYNLAYYESDDRSKYVGGSLGSFHAGQTVKEFDDALNEMKKGEISDLVRTMYGFHIIKMDDVKEARELGYDEASGMVRDMLEKQQREKIYDAWMKANQEKFPLQMSE